MRAELIRGAGLRGGRDCDESGTARTAGLPGERDCESGLREGRPNSDSARGGGAAAPRFPFSCASLAVPLTSQVRVPCSPGFLAVPVPSQFRSPGSPGFLAVPLGAIRVDEWSSASSSKVVWMEFLEGPIH